MTNAPAATADKAKSQDIYTGYAGKFDAATLQTDLKTKADKPYARAVLVVSDDKKVSVTAFTLAAIEELKKAVATDAPGIVQGYLGDAPGYLTLHKVGASPYVGELASVRSGVSEKGVPYFNAILKADIEGRDKPLNLIAKAFGDDAKALAELKDGDKITAEGYPQREKVGSADAPEYRSGVMITKLEGFTRAPAAPKSEADNSPTP